MFGAPLPDDYDVRASKPAAAPLGTDKRVDAGVPSRIAAILRQIVAIEICTFT